MGFKNTDWRWRRMFVFSAAAAGVATGFGVLHAPVAAAAATSNDVRVAPGASLLVPPMCQKQPQWAPQVTLGDGTVMHCGTNAPAATVAPQTPQACATPAAGDWCPSWTSVPYDGPGHRLDTPGNAMSGHVSATSPDGSLLFIAGTSDQSGSGSPNYQVVTLAYDAHTGHAMWTAPFVAPSGAQSYAQALVAGGWRVFVEIQEAQPGHDLTVAYDARTGALLWQSPFTSSPFAGLSASSISADGSVLYVAGITGVDVGGTIESEAATVAYDAATGTQLWTAGDVGTGAFGVATAGGRVFMASSVVDASGYLNRIDLTVLDAASGTTLGTGQEAVHGDDAAGVAVASDGSRAFAAYQDLFNWPDGSAYETMAVIGFDGANGNALWKADYIGPNADTPTKFNGYSFYLPWAPLAVAPDGSRVYAAGPSSDGQFGAAGTGFTTVAFDAATGGQVWASAFNTDTPVFYIGVGPVVAVDPGGNAVYVAGEANQATTFATVAYNATDGSTRQVSIYDGSAIATASALTVSPDGSQAFVGAEVGTPTTAGSINYDIEALGYPAGTALAAALPETPWAAALLVAGAAIACVRVRQGQRRGSRAA